MNKNIRNLRFHFKMKRFILPTLVFISFCLSSCKKNTTESLQEHPDYQGFLALFENAKLPLSLQWKSTQKNFEWSKNKPLEEKYVKLFVDSLAYKTSTQYYPKFKILEKDNFAVLILGNSATVHDMPGWMVLSLRKDGKIISKEHFRFAKNSIGNAKLIIQQNGDIFFEKSLKIFEKGAIRTILNTYQYKINDEGYIKEKNEDQTENLTLVPNSFLNNFPQGTTPFYLNSDFLHSIKNYRLSEYQELMHESWYHPLDIDTVLSYFPQLERTLGDRIQVACGAYKLIYKHKNFSVGLLVTRQAGSQFRTGVTAFHLFTFDRKTQKCIDFLPMVAYIVEIWNEEKNQFDLNLGSFQFFDDLRFVLRNLKGLQESSKDKLRSGYVKDDGFFFLLN